jgi:type IV pilus assembly protein PilY1
VVTDVDFGYACGSAVAGGCVAGTADWRTILVGGLGKGGKSFYAIDVTNPAAMTTETAVAGKVLWEFTDSKMGYSFGPAAVIKTRKYGWVVVLTSGYNNPDGHSYTFLVNPKTGALLETVTVDNTVGTVANPSGLSDTQAFVPDYGDGTADALYAGDLLGNLWRFDLTSAGATSYPVPVKLVTAKDGSAAAQPITTAPLIEIAANSSKRYVLFGTGKSLGSGDLATTQVNTLYSVWDGASTFGGFLTAATLPGGTTYPITRSQLNQDANLLTGIGSSPTSPMGFYFDLGKGTNGTAEQIDLDPIANNGIVAFAANLSSGDVCSPSGTGRVIALAVATGKSVLVDSSGNATTSFSVSPGRVIDMTFVNVDSKRLYLTVGTTQNDLQFGQSGQTGQGGQGPSAVNPPANLSSNGSVTKLNWREVKGGN